MHRNLVVALVGALTIAVAVAGGALAASTGPAVKVQIKTQSKTLKTAVVHGRTGWITKAGAPKGKCSANSGAGALNAATHGKWTAKWYPKFGDYLVGSVLGVKPKGKDFWELVVNGKPASSGICHVKLKAHQTIVFKIAK
jgi:uncharacterized low-complexity protein